MIQKEIMGKELEKYIEENFETDEAGCWEKALHMSALLLLPNYKPKKCTIENCDAEICNHCFQKTKLCLECKIPPPINNYHIIIRVAFDMIFFIIQTLQ